MTDTIKTRAEINAEKNKNKNPHTTCNEIDFLDGLMSGGFFQFTGRGTTLSKWDGVRLVQNWLVTAQNRRWGAGVNVDKCIDHARKLLRDAERNGRPTKKLDL